MQLKSALHLSTHPEHIVTVIIPFIPPYFFCSHFSIGVTTGVAFCGVVGHPQRHEYTGEFFGVQLARAINI